MKKHARTIAVSVIALLLFNLIAFVFPFSKSNTYWAAYAFGTIAILVEIIVCLYANSSSKELKSRFYGWPLIYVASVYVAIQLIISLIFMGISSAPLWTAVILSGAGLGIALLGLITVDAAKETIEEIDHKVSEKVFYIRSLESDMNNVLERCSDSVARKNIRELAEAIRYSDPMSSPQLAMLESKLESICAEIGEAIDAENYEQANTLCKTAKQVLAERNQKCKLLK